MGADAAGTASRRSVIDRVRKIRRRTEDRGCTPAEAEEASRMAGQLMVRHGLSEADLSPADDPNQLMASMHARATKAAAREATRAARAAASLAAWEADRKAGRCGRPVHDPGAVERFCRRWEAFQRGR